MNFIKRLIPNKIKQEGRYLLYDLLKIPYNRFKIPLDIVKWLPANKPITFVDIGASKGTFSEALQQFYVIERGVLIEPISSLIPILEGKFQDKSKYEIHNLAISERAGESTFYLSDELDVMSSLLKIKDEFYNPFLLTSSGRKITVPTDTLDNITRQSNLNSIDLLKIDVQGAEHMVLKGATDTLKITRIVHTEFSYRPLYEGSSTFFDVYNIFLENNFRLVGTETACNVNGEIVQGDGIFVNNSYFPGHP